jgi:capsular polysaccharide biosynthesis protein
MFPQNIVNKILQKMSDNNKVNYNKNIFITRGKALHLPRNLNNQEEIETYFKSLNYDVINPEIIDLKLFINSIKNAENIYITWGGAMVNLCYVNPNTNIYLLQSKSYMNENIFMIFKFLKNYKNLHLIKCDDNNNIDMKNANIIKI